MFFVWHYITVDWFATGWRKGKTGANYTTANQNEFSYLKEPMKIQR